MAGRELTPTHTLAAVEAAELVRQVATLLQAQQQTQWAALDLLQQLVAHRLHTQGAAVVAHRVHPLLALVVLVVVALVDIAQRGLLERRIPAVVVAGQGMLHLLLQAVRAAPVSSFFNTLLMQP
jgi:hypothetical protein